MRMCDARGDPPSINFVLSIAETDRRDFYDTVMREFPFLLPELHIASVRRAALHDAMHNSEFAWLTYPDARNDQLPEVVKTAMRRPPSHRAALEFLGASIDLFDRPSSVQYQDAALAACIAADSDRMIAVSYGLQWNQLR
jgi:hypothetical protein